MENRVLEYRPIRLVPWNFGTRILSETVLTVEKTILRKTRKKDTILLAALVYGTPLFAANLKVEGNFRVSTRRVSMTS